MSGFYAQLLTTTGADANKWRALLARLAQVDIYFTPEYITAFETTQGETRSDFGGEGKLFVYGNEENCIIYPFFKRKINELPFYKLLSLDSIDWFDIISPYGYSGPLAFISEPEVESKIWEQFLKEFHDYCLKSNIVAEFTRLNPYLKNHLPLSKLTGVDVKKRSEVVYIELEQDVAVIRQNATKGNKSSLAKARRSGVKILGSRTKEDIDGFYQLYIDTMERNKAKESYFFSREFFDSLFQLLGGDIQLFGAWYKDRMIAASLFLFKKDLAHYYLSGSDYDSLSLCPNNLLLYEVILQTKGQGYKIFDLGGGYEPNDSLFQFKASFSRSTAGFYTYSRIHNELAYEELCQARVQYDELTGKEIVPSDYFPAYRR